MTWLAILKLLLTVAETLTGYMREKQLLDAGEAKNLARGLQEALHVIEEIKAAKRALKHDPDSVHNDPDNRNNKPPMP
jgi:hypothetical protein